MADLPHRTVPDTQSTLNFEDIDQKLKRVVYVTDFGAKGDGSSNDTPAIQRAINEVGQKGGGRVVFPKGTYYLAQSGTAGGLSWCLYVAHDNIHLDFEPGAILTSDATASLIEASGRAKPTGDYADWQTYWLGDATTATYRAISSVAKGDTSITTTTASHAGDFSAGDRIYIRTGQCVASSTTEPDAEINEVVSADSGTGVVELKYPTAKAYVAENYDSGSSGKSSPGGGGSATTFGVANVNDRILRNFKITGLTIENTAYTSSALRCTAIDGLTIEGLRGTTYGNVLGNIECRNSLFRDWRVEQNNTATASTYRWVYAFGTGCVDALVDNVWGDGTGNRMFVHHIHEGSAQITVQNCQLTTRAGNNDLNPLSIRARGYDILIKDCRFYSESTAQTVQVTDEVTGGVTLDNVITTANDATDGIRIDGENVTLRNMPDEQIISRFSAGGRAPETSGSIEYLVASVLYTDTTVNLGTLPAQAMVLGQIMSLDVTTAFNGTGTNRLTVGWSGSTNALLASAAALDLGTTGRKDITTAHYGTTTGRYSSTARELIATYTDSAGDASAGACRIVIPYVRVPSAS